MATIMKDFYRRKLPHWIPSDAIFFITFRLANSLPANIIKKLVEEKENHQKIIQAKFQEKEQKERLYELEKKYFRHFDAWLDRCHAESPVWLRQEKIARIVSEVIHEFDGQRYALMAYCIMPNHVHLLIDTRGYKIDVSHRGTTAHYPLSDMLKQLKGRSSHLANQALKRSRMFWQHESYDHVVRDSKELERIHWYILNNPVKAGLVTQWQDWPYSWSKLVGN